MSGAITCAATLTLIAVVLAVVLSSAELYAQDDRILTIADCPKGYTLGIIDLDRPQPLARRDDYLSPRTGQETLAAAQEAAAMPRALATGCIPPQTKENTR